MDNLSNCSNFFNSQSSTVNRQCLVPADYVQFLLNIPADYVQFLCNIPADFV